jgi:hypothetical protein
VTAATPRQLAYIAKLEEDLRARAVVVPRLSRPLRTTREAGKRIAALHELLNAHSFTAKPITDRQARHLNRMMKKLGESDPAFHQTDAFTAEEASVMISALEPAYREARRETRRTRR